MALKWLSRRMSLGMIKEAEGVREPRPDSPSNTSPVAAHRRSSRALLLRPRAFLRANFTSRSSRKSCDDATPVSPNHSSPHSAPDPPAPEESLPNRMPTLDKIEEGQLSHSLEPMVHTMTTGLKGGAKNLTKICANMAGSFLPETPCAGIQKTSNIEEVFVLKQQVQPPSNEHVKVLYARRVDNNDPVVVKVLQKTFFAISGEEKLWRVNAEIMLQLQRSRFLCNILQVYEDRLAYYVSMERVSGQDLYEVLTGKETLSEIDVKEVLRQLLSGLRDLHKICIHRDIKLENVMLARVRRGDILIKIIDFDTIQTLDGVCEQPRPGSEGRTGRRSSHKVTIVGTDQYIAPEAYEGAYSKASDIFAVGVIAYILCSRKFPFQHKVFDDKPGENYVGSPKMHEIAEKLRAAELNWEKDFKDNGLAADFCKQLMCIDPKDRPSADEALEHPWLDEGSAVGKALSMF